MDQDLVIKIRESLQNQEHTYELDAETTASALTRAEAKFITNPNVIWWWESLRYPSRVIEYGEADAFSKILGLIGKDEIVRLVVTDDEPGPWPVFEGPLHEIICIIRGQRFFEYFLISAKSEISNWMIFDNHHNQLVITGEI
jgi:hypothetical protein